MEPDEAQGAFTDIFRLHGDTHQPGGRVQHQAGDSHQRDSHQPEGQGVDQGGRLGVAAGPEHTGDIGDVKGAHGHKYRVNDRQIGGRLDRAGGQLEQGEQYGAEEGRQQHQQQRHHGGADEHGHQQQGPAHAVDLLPVMALADLLAHHDSGGGGDAEADHGGDLVDVADQGIGGQHVLAVGHVAHNHRQHGGAHAPQRLIADHGDGVFQKAAQDGLAGTEDAAPAQGQAFVPQGKARRHKEFHHPAGKGRHRRAGDAHGGRAEVAEDQHEVEEGIHAHGDGKEDHAEGRILRAALHTGIDAAQAVEDVGETDDLDVGHRQLHQLLVGGNQPQHLGGKEESNEGQHDREAGDGVHGHAHAAVDAVRVPPAPVLADQHRQAALETEDHHLDNENRHIGGGNSRHLGVAQQAHHKGVRKAQGGGNDILQDHRQAQHQQPVVKAGLPAKCAKHSDLLYNSKKVIILVLLQKKRNQKENHYSMGKRVVLCSRRAAAKASMSSNTVSGPKLTRTVPAAVFLSRPMAVSTWLAFPR